MKNGIPPQKKKVNIFKQNPEDGYMDMCIFIDSPDFISHDKVLK